jgi:hypothetical protein
MPVLVNSQTQLAENLPQDQADQALHAGTHELPLNDPEGNPVTAPLDQAQSLIGQGYSQPHPDQLNSLLDYAKYSSTPEQAKTALEGAGQAMTFGLSSAAERGLGVDPNAMLARQETNPGMHMLGEAGGLMASSLIPGLGEANLARGAGEGVSAAMGLGEGAGVLSQIGSAAVKNAVETSLIASGDEASKYFLSDPHQTAETAMTDIGLNGLLGGALGAGFGVAPPLWKATQETSVGKFLNAITQKANGLEKATLPDASIGAAADAAGINLAPEIKSALSDNPEARGMFQSLAESTTRSGKEATQSMNAFRSQANSAILTSLGKTPEDVDALANLSTHDAGSNLRDSLVNEIKSRIDPLSAQFEKVRDQFAKTEMNQGELTDLSNNIGQLATDNGYHLVEGSPQGALINKALASLPNVKTLEDLRKVQSSFQDLTQQPEMWNLGKGLKNVFRNAEEDVVNSRLGEQAPELLQAHADARAQYRSSMSTIDDLNDRLHVGRYSGPGSFLTALKDMNPEDILRRLTPKNDASLLSTMDSEFPATSQAMKESYLNQALKTGSARAAEGEAINPTSFFKALDGMSPELRQYALPQGAEGQIGAVRQLIDKIPKSMNPSGTAKTIDALWSKVPGGAVSMASLLTGHNPIAGYVLGSLGRLVGREAPDAMKLATLKFLGSDVPINSTAFRALAELASSSVKGQKMTQNAVKALFKSGAQVLPQGLDVKDRDVDSLKKKLDKLQDNPGAMLKTGGDINHYAPDHGVAFGAMTARAVQYLKSIKPNADPMGPLDGNRVPTKIEESKYDRAVAIAQQPLSIFNHMKKGDMTPDDVTTLKTIYPALYNSLNQKITNAAIEHLKAHDSIPYRTRISLAMFTGMPLDSTMQPQAMMMAQNTFMPPGPSAPAGGSPKRGSMSQLGKMSTGMEQTPLQAREARKTAAA